MPDSTQYKQLMNEIIEKQSAILGPDIAILKARNVDGLDINDDGEVTAVDGDPKAILENLIDQYVNLSGQIVKSTLSSVFSKYPELGNEINSNGVT
jgi:hypothetical protein